VLGSCQAWHPGLFRQMARTTAGICVEFTTDAREVAIEVRVDEEPSGTRRVLDGLRMEEASGSVRWYDQFSVDVDGRHEALGMPEGGERLVTCKLASHDPAEKIGLQPLPGLERERHVRIWLPVLRGCALRDVWALGSQVHAVPARRQLLVLGDSVAQGFVAQDPAHTWPVLLADRLHLDVLNQGIGGQVFQPGLIAGLEGAADPAHIVVALGENYRYERCTTDLVARDIARYFFELARLWPQVPTQVLTPLWHDEDASPSHPLSCWEQVPDFIAEQVGRYAQMSLVDGLELCDHDASCYADPDAHPNAKGFRQMALRLHAVQSIPGLRPSSVGKRRKARRKPREQEPPTTANMIPLPLGE
jgi:lysophospholipase L1-like esterase